MSDDIEFNDPNSYSGINRRFHELDMSILNISNRVEVNKDEINSLRASRHEHANTLTLHTLEISEFKFKLAQFDTKVSTMCTKFEKLETDFANFKADFQAYQISILQQFASLKSDLRQTSWIVAVVAAVIVVFGKTLLSKIGL